jgi:exopolysaccharide biosynthesis polyprenyl glycosylphosphotransferase
MQHAERATTASAAPPPRTTDRHPRELRHHLDPTGPARLAPAPTDPPVPSPSPGRTRAALIAADAVSTALGFAVAFAVQSALVPVPASIASFELILAVASLPGFAVGAMANHLYLSRANERPTEELRNIVRTVAIGIVALVVVSFVVQYEHLSRLWVLTAAAAITTVLLVERFAARRMFQRLRRQGRLRRPILIVGTDTHAIALMHMYRRNAHLGYDVVGFVGPDPMAGRADVPVLGGLDDVTEVARTVGAVGVVVSLHSIDADEVNALTRELTDARLHVALSSSLCDIDISRLRPQELGGCTLIYVEQVIRGGWRRVAKRWFDVVVAATLLVLSAPVLAVAAAAIKLTSPGPVLFRQTRVGKDGEPFEIVKLRTMTVDAEARKAELLHANEADGPLFKMRADPRVTGVGRWLRTLSVDEIPQLVCVLRGTMSMVGPRPALPDEMAEWDPEVRKRLRVLPGLTGLWQVSGRSDSSFDQYKRLDLYYVDNWRFTHDLRICVRTVGEVLRRRGAV